MEVVSPSVELLVPKNAIQHIARCARVCYGKDNGDDERLFNNLIARKHFSMFRHYTAYYIIDNPYSTAGYLARQMYTTLNEYNPVGINIKFDNKNKVYYIAANFQWIREFKEIDDVLCDFKVNPDYFSTTEIGYSMMRYSFLCTTQISTSRELNRVSPNNIAEQSTRYVYENGSICKPWWFEHNYDINLVNKYLDICKNQFKEYKNLIDSGLKQEDARGVLPLDTTTKVIYTYSVDEWKHIIDLRYYGNTGKPHPNAKIIAGMIKDQLNQLRYDI